MKKKIIYFVLIAITVLMLQSCNNKYDYIGDPITYLKTIEFIEEKDGTEVYNFEKLDTINGEVLFYLVQRTNNLETKNLSFVLKIMGLSLPDSIQRKAFTTLYLEKDTDYNRDFVFLERFNSLNKNSRYSEALIYFAKSLDADQTKKVLEAFGFLLSKNTTVTDYGHYSIHDEKIEHLPNQLLQIFIDNLHKGFTSPQEKLFSKRIQGVIDNKNK